MCGFHASASAAASEPSPPEVIDVVMSSTPTDSEERSLKSCLMSEAKASWMSPVSTTGLRTPAVVHALTTRSREAT